MSKKEHSVVKVAGRSGMNICMFWSSFLTTLLSSKKNIIGYPSFGSRDNGARYVSEYDYITHFKKQPGSDRCFKPLRWPESQLYLFPNEPNDALYGLNEPIQDECGIEDFGENAVWVPLCNLKE